jgi:hypothetical protein
VFLAVVGIHGKLLPIVLLHLLLVEEGGCVDRRDKLLIPNFYEHFFLEWNRV